MNQKIVDAAKAALHGGDYALTKGYCSRFCRQVTETCYGNKYDYLFGASAIETGHNFDDAGLSCDPSDGLQPGDFVIKMHGSGNFGHIAIYIDDNTIVENSSTRIGRVRGALGTRTRAQWGHIDLVGRINDAPAKPAPKYALYLTTWDYKLLDMTVSDQGQSLCPVRKLGAALGVDVDWDEDSNHVIWGGNEIDNDVTIVDGSGCLPISVLAAKSGLQLEVNDKDKKVRLHR